MLIIVLRRVFWYSTVSSLMQTPHFPYQKEVWLNINFLIHLFDIHAPTYSVTYIELGRVEYGCVYDPKPNFVSADIYVGVIIFSTLELDGRSMSFGSGLICLHRRLCIVVSNIYNFGDRRTIQYHWTYRPMLDTIW